MTAALPEAGPEPAEGEPSPRWFFGVLILISLGALALHGYGYLAGDNLHWVPLIHHALDPALYPGDPAVAFDFHGLTLWVDGVAALARVVGVPWALFLLYLLCHTAFFVLAGRLGERLTGSRTAALFGVALLAFPRAVGGSATVTLPTQMVPRFLALDLGLGAVLLAMAGRPLWAGVVLGAAFLVNPLGALPVAAALGAWYLWRHARRPRRWAPFAAACALVSAPVWFHWLAAGEGGPPRLAPDPEWLGWIRASNPYALLSAWQAHHFLYVLLPLLLLALGLVEWQPGGAAEKIGDTLALAAGGLALTGLGALVGELAAVPALVSLQTTRALLVPTLLGYLVVGRAIERAVRAGPALALSGGALWTVVFFSWWGLAFGLVGALAATAAWSERGAGRARLTLAGIAAVAFATAALYPSLLLHDLGRAQRVALLVGGAALGYGLLLCRERAIGPASAAAVAAILLIAAGIAVQGGSPRWIWKPQVPLARWASENTPTDARFVMLPPSRGFRGAARRTVLLERQDAGPSVLSRAYAAAYRERRRRHRRWREALPRVPAGLEADYLAVGLGLPQPDLPRVHAGEGRAVYRLP